jgi:outer membrane protein OmpA-like peptidoglycan-associated protein
MKTRCAALLGGVAASVLLLANAPAQAQVQMPGWFGSVTGWWYPWNDTGSRLHAFDIDDPSFGRDVKTPGDGFGGRAYLGYRFSNPYDLAIGLQRSWLSKGPTLSADLDDEGGVDTLRQKADYWLIDLEAGYNMMGSAHALRLFAGARLVQFDNDARGIEDNGTPLQLDTRFRGIGPRIGIDGAFRLGEGSNFSLFAGGSASVLFGRIKADALRGGGPAVPASSHDTRTVWNAEGQLGISYDIAANTTIAVGYRGEYWRGVVFKNFEMDDADDFGASGGKGHRFMHGPFVRLAYNIGAPKGAPAPVAAPAPVMAKSFIVFFDFDRSVLTPTALGTIKQAADAAKAGRSARVNVTGHADKSGGDQYNMALSLRRANAVKDELVRQGVPAASIVVVGRGESQPLVPTADGVKEPQNRRVEIVLN